MSDNLAELCELIDGMERSATKVAMLEQAIRLADTENDTQLGFEIRQMLVREATFTGFPDKALVAFTWNLAQVDREPEVFDEFEILWQYKWIIESVKRFPQISMKQIDDALADLDRRFTRNGASQRPVHLLRCTTAAAMGDRDLVEKTLPLWNDAPPDFLSDCPACDRHELVRVHFFLGQDQRAFTLAKPILEGEMTCGEVPHLTYPLTFIPLLHLKRADEAMEYHRKGYPLVRDNPKFLPELAEYLIFETLVEDFAAAVKLFERHLPLAMETAVPLWRYEFFRAATFLFRRLVKSGKATRTLRLPDSFALKNDTGTYDLAELAGWFEKEARELAKQFDSRSGNDYRLKQIDELNKLGEHARAD
jgi:hypothetical protein